MFDTSHNLVTYIFWKPYTCKTFYIHILMWSDTLKIFYSSLKLKKSWKINFFSSFWASKSPLSLASNLKKSHVDTFVCIKTVWSFVWSRQSLLHVPMDLNMCLTSYFGIFSALEILGEGPKYKTVIYKITSFCDPLSWFLLGECFWEFYL